MGTRFFQRAAIASSAVIMLCAVTAPFTSAQIDPIEDGQIAKTFDEWSERNRIGYDIPCASWIDPKVTPWAVMLCIHGLSLHSNSYEALGKRMAALGVPTYAIDVRGFGSWQNTRGSINSRVDFKSAMADIHHALESLRTAHPELPIVLVGESMGGALALQAAAQNKELIDGLVCSVPASKRTNQKMNTARVAVGLLTGPNRKFNAGPSVVRAAAQQNPELVNTWTSDGMTKMKLSSKELLDFALFTSKNAAHAQQIDKTPVLFLQGAKDKLISPQGTIELYNKLATPKKTLHIVNSEHLILEYSQFNNELIDYIAGWLQRHAVPSALARLTQEDSKVSPAVLEQAQGHLQIAQGFLKLNDAKSAAEHLLKAIEIAKGTHVAQDAELILCTLPENDLVQEGHDEAAVKPEDLKFITHQAAMDNTKPSVIMFYANWIIGCKSVEEALQTALKQFGGKVNFVRINADDPGSQDIIKRYGVRPIPAVLYLSGDNHVVGYTFGYPGHSAIEAKIRRLVLEARKSTN
jgi:acylglycerol lipase